MSENLKSVWIVKQGKYFSAEIYIIAVYLSEAEANCRCIADGFMPDPNEPIYRNDAIRRYRKITELQIEQNEKEQPK
jgi:hypothetical protein